MHHPDDSQISCQAQHTADCSHHLRSTNQHLHSHCLPAASRRTVQVLPDQRPVIYSGPVFTAPGLQEPDMPILPSIPDDTLATVGLPTKTGAVLSNSMLPDCMQDLRQYGSLDPSKVRFYTSPSVNLMPTPRNDQGLVGSTVHLTTVRDANIPPYWTNSLSHDRCCVIPHIQLSQAITEGTPSSQQPQHSVVSDATVPIGIMSPGVQDLPGICQFLSSEKTAPSTEWANEPTLFKLLSPILSLDPQLSTICSGAVPSYDRDHFYCTLDDGQWLRVVSLLPKSAASLKCRPYKQDALMPVFDITFSNISTFSSTSSSAIFWPFDSHLDQTTIESCGPFSGGKPSYLTFLDNVSDGSSFDRTPWSHHSYIQSSSLLRPTNPSHIMKERHRQYRSGDDHRPLTDLDSSTIHHCLQHLTTSSGAVPSNNRLDLSSSAVSCYDLDPCFDIDRSTTIFLALSHRSTNILEVFNDNNHAGEQLRHSTNRSAFHRPSDSILAGTTLKSQSWMPVFQDTEVAQLHPQIVCLRRRLDLSEDCRSPPGTYISHPTTWALPDTTYAAGQRRSFEMLNASPDDPDDRNGDRLTQVHHHRPPHLTTFSGVCVQT